MRKNVPFQKFSVVGFAFKRFTLISFLCFSMCLFFSESRSQAQLLKDIGKEEEIFNNEYSGLTTVNGTIYYISQGKDLWKADGTPAGNVFLKSFKSVSNLTPVGAVLYFKGDDGKTGTELWKTDGTPAGTVLVKDISSGIAGSTPEALTALNGILYFTANDGKSGKEIWKSDGTISGTMLVKDIFPGGGSSSPSRLTNVNGILFCQANDNINGYELWKSNGTAAGTTMVKDIKTGSKQGSYPELLTNVNGVLYFVALDNTTGRELWKSNGTGTGTLRVKDIVPGAGDAAIDNMINVNGILYFSANDGKTGKELWKSNGTDAGTILVKDIRPGPDGSDAEGTPMGNFTAINGKLYFLAGNYYSPAIYMSDGTSGGTKILNGIGAFGGAPAHPCFTYYKGSIYYLDGNMSQSDMYKPKLIKMNPDGSGITVIKEFAYLWYNTPFNPEMTSNNSFLFFPNRLSESQGYKLIRSDGTAAGTIVLKDAAVSTLGSDPGSFLVNGNFAYFKATTGSSVSLFKTDATSTGTIPLKSFGDIFEMQNVGSGVFLSAAMNPNLNNLELYKSDGTATGTVLIKSNSTEGTRARWMVDVNGTLFFTDYNGGLWKSDGTSGGTLILKSFSHVTSITNVNGIAMVVVQRADGGQELWKSNGTTGGTVLVKVIRTGPGNIQIRYSTKAVKNLFYFTADDGVSGSEVWRSDGTAAGTFMLKNISSYNESQGEDDIHSLVAFRDSLYFLASTFDTKWAIYKSNGTTAGTVKAADINGVGLLLTPANNKIYAFDYNTDGVVEMWASNGTVKGTKMIKTLTDNRLYYDYEIINDILFFNWLNIVYPAGGSGSTRSGRLWRSDGTSCGTFEINIGAEGPLPIVSLGTNLVFGASTPRTGVEPFSYNTAQAPGSPCIKATADSETVEVLSEGKEIVSYAPNPFTNDMHLHINGKDEDLIKVKVIAISGQTVETFDDLRANTDYSIGNNWPSGLYVIHVHTAGKLITQKVIKK